MTLLRIPAGEFLMGSNDQDKMAFEDEKPQHKIYLTEYWIGKTPVTNAQYQAFVQAENQETHDDWEAGEIIYKRSLQPVVNVSWHDSRAFCEWLNQFTGKSYCLPTEAQWEKAARGTDGRLYPWGNQAPDISRCNFDNKFGATTVVGKFSPDGDSPYGCQDMSGNIDGWTSSLFDDYPYQEDDGREDADAIENRVLRGGTWYSDGARNVRSADRSNFASVDRDDLIGFRCSRLP